MLLMIGFGCSKETKVVNTPTVAQETDNKTLEVKSQILDPWDEKKKNFWILMMKNTRSQFNLAGIILKYLKKLPEWRKIGVMTK